MLMTANTFSNGSMTTSETCFPNRVRFVSKQYKYDKAFWVQFNKFAYGTLAEIDAKFTKENALEIATKNLEKFTLEPERSSQIQTRDCSYAQN